jgi:hypothetical protein
MKEKITTVEEFVKGAVSLGDQPYFSEESLRDFTQRLLDMQTEAGYDIDTEVNTAKSRKVRMLFYGPDFREMERISELYENAHRYVNCLLCEVYRLRAQLAAVTRDRDVAREAVRLSATGLRCATGPGCLYEGGCRECEAACAYALAEAAYLEQHAPDELMTMEEMTREVEG